MIPALGYLGFREHAYSAGGPGCKFIQYGSMSNVLLTGAQSNPGQAPSPFFFYSFPFLHPHSILIYLGIGFIYLYIIKNCFRVKVILASCENIIAMVIQKNTTPSVRAILIYL